MTHHTAYKFARIRPLIFLGHVLFRLPFSRMRRARYLKKYGPGYRTALLTDLFAGIFANRREFTYWQTHQEDTRVIPTTRLILGGLLVIQPRGLPLPEPYRSGTGLEHAIPGDLKHVEITKACQYAVHPRTSRVVLVDYGNAMIVDRLRNTLAAA